MMGNANIEIIWDIALCSLYANRRFRGRYRLHLQSRNQPSKKSGSWPWRRRWYDPPIRRYTFGMCGSTSQKMATFITTAVRSSNPTIGSVGYIPSIAVTTRCKTWTVFAHSNTGIVGSNPSRDMDVCVCLICVFVGLCVGSVLATVWFPVQAILPTVYRTKKRKKWPMSKKWLQSHNNNNNNNSNSKHHHQHHHKLYIIWTINGWHVLGLC
jgi:hypothetical protein